MAAAELNRLSWADDPMHACRDANGNEEYCDVAAHWPWEHTLAHDAVNGVGVACCWVARRPSACNIVGQIVQGGNESIVRGCEHCGNALSKSMENAYLKVCGAPVAINAVKRLYGWKANVSAISRMPSAFAPQTSARPLEVPQLFTKLHTCCRSGGCGHKEPLKSKFQSFRKSQGLATP